MILLTVRCFVRQFDVMLICGIKGNNKHLCRIVGSLYVHCLRARAHQIYSAGISTVYGYVRILRHISTWDIYIVQQ